MRVASSEAWINLSSVTSLYFSKKSRLRAESVDVHISRLLGCGVAGRNKRHFQFESGQLRFCRTGSMLTLPDDPRSWMSPELRRNLGPRRRYGLSASGRVR